MGLQGGLNALVQMSGTISETGGGGGGSEVSYTATLQSGTQIGTLTIDDIDYNLYAPEGGDSVEYTAIQQSGTKIGTITINDTNYDIYAPTGGGGGGSEVSFTQVLGSGTKIGTITIDDTPTDIYAPTPPDAVSYTEIQQSGTKIGTITIGSTSTDIYIPNPVTTLRGLSDVEFNPYITNGNIMMFNGSKWTDSVLPIRTFPIGSLTDVDITSVTNGQVLKYNSTSEKWENYTPYKEFTAQLSIGATTVTISDAYITTNSTVDIYTDVFGVYPSNVVVNVGSIVLTFAARSSVLNVKVRCY